LPSTNLLAGSFIWWNRSPQKISCSLNTTCRFYSNPSSLQGP